MQQVQLKDRTIIEVNEGGLSSKDSEVLELASTILDGEFGRFNNDEIYPDKDYAIADFLAEQLHGEVVEKEEA